MFRVRLYVWKVISPSKPEYLNGIGYARIGGLSFEGKPTLCISYPRFTCHGRNALFSVRISRYGSNQSLLL